MEITEEEVRDLFMDIFGLTASIIKESERASVILAAARLDVDLERLLKHILHKNPGGTDSLFDSDRALGSFSAKISLTFRLGLIDSDFEHGLQLVRKIRNDFAHQLEDESLSSQRQKGRLNELVRWLQSSPIYASAVKTINPKDKSIEHVQFTACIVCMTIEFKRGMRNFSRVHIGTPLTCTSLYDVSRVLLTKDKFVEASLQKFLITEPLFDNMKFMLDVRDGVITITSLPVSRTGSGKTFNFEYTMPSDGSLSDELDRLRTVIRKEILAED